MDARARAARYYDANPVFPNDIPFYRARIPSPRARVLELGCGTGRVLVSLLEHCGYIHGIDHSEEMLARCRAKLRARGVLLRNWVSGQEFLIWETPYQGGRLTCHDRRLRMDREKLALYPELVYRWYEQDVLKETVVEPLVMRCYYPDQFLRLIEGHDFRVTGRWGGYDGQTYGEGPELVAQFTVPDQSETR